MREHVTITSASEARNRHDIALLGEETQRQLSLRVQQLSPGYGTPLHIHREQAETFHVVSGQFRFRVGDQELVGEPGMTVFVPKGTPHQFLYEDRGQGVDGQLISVLTPGVHDGFIQRIPEAQSQGAGADALAALAALATEFGAEILGPNMSPGDAQYPSQS